MNPKPLDAGLAERLWNIGYNAAQKEGGYYKIQTWRNACNAQRVGWRAVAAAVRKIVKEAKEGE